LKTEADVFRNRPRNRPLALYLIGLVMLVAVPLALASSIAFVLFARHQQRSAENQLLEMTRAVAIYTDLRVQSDLQELQSLAESESLRRRDFAAFERESEHEALRRRSLYVALRDASGKLLMSTIAPEPGAEHTLPDFVRKTIETGKPYVSDVVGVPLLGRPGVVLSVPVFRGDRLAYVLTAAPDMSRQLLDLLSRQRLPPEGIGTIMDRQGWYIARTLNPEQSLGKQASEQYRARALSAPEGIVKNVNPEGHTVYGTFVRTSFGWIAALALPASVIEGPYRRALLAMGAMSFLSLVAGALLAIIFGRKISRSLERLARAAVETGEGRIPQPLDEPILEVDLVRAALVSGAEQRERLLSEYARARDSADAANRSKDEFLAMLGHELRNPVGAISNAVSVLERTGKPDDSMAPMRHIIERQTQHLARLVDDLLDASRVATGKIALERRPLDLSDVLARCLRALDTQKGRLQVEFNVEEGVWINADETRIGQVIDNLLSNAVKYTPDRGRISVRLTRQADRALLTVEDSGIGIPADLLPRVFDLFVQGDRPLDRTTGGLGIGLTLVRRLIELHGGTVSASSDGPGKGTKMTVSFPCIAAPALPNTGEARVSASQKSAGRKVLIVEDNEDNRESLRMLLMQLGYDVSTASDGHSGLASALADRPDVALIDIGLPGLNGYEVAEAIRKSNAGGDITLVAVTGYGSADDAERAARAGFDAHLVKPADLYRLREILDRASTAGKPGNIRKRAE
jgi:signal transduction histidine kinase/ActR/RegA family two-component response regulator